MKRRIKAIEYVTRRELGDCPASVDMNEGIIEINEDVWDHYDDFQKRFILFHEEAHYVLQTDSEQAADTYALRQVAGKYPRSLARSIETLFKVGICNDERYDNIYREALKLDYKMGNKNALIELQKFENMNNFSPKNRKNRVDGGVEPERSHKINGFVIGNMYLSFTNLLLIVTVFVLIGIKSNLKS